MARTDFTEQSDITQSHLFSISMTFKNPEEWNKWLNANTLFNDYYKKLFKQCVFEIHKYLIRLTPMQTGRLRGGWTGILNKYGIDYSAAMADVSLLDHFINKVDSAAIAEGMALSNFRDSDLLVTIMNDVFYGEYVEFGTSKMEGQAFTDRARYKGEYIFTKEIDDWFKEMTEKQDLVPPPPVEEVTA